DRMFCVDCNEKLNDNDNENLQQDVQSKIDELYDKKLSVNVFDKIIGFVSLVGVVATIIVFISNAITQTSCEALGWSLITFALSSFEAFCPKINWELEKLALSFRVSSSFDLEPSDFYFIRRKLAIIILSLLGMVMLTINLLQ
ncbi:MAG: hypothetical protein IKJ93_05395, partial [Clostridia bacterium]|nr:hypothetical protein [Clostridia bacterium]